MMSLFLFAKTTGGGTSRGYVRSVGARGFNPAGNLKNAPAKA